MSKQQSWKQKTGLDVGDFAHCSGLVKYKNKGYNIDETVKILEIKTNACACIVSELNGEKDVKVSILKKYLSKIKDEEKIIETTSEMSLSETDKEQLQKTIFVPSEIEHHSVAEDTNTDTISQQDSTTASDKKLEIEESDADTLANLLDTLPDESEKKLEPVSDQTVIYKPKEVENVLTDKTKVIDLADAFASMPLEKEMEHVAKTTDRTVSTEENSSDQMNETKSMLENKEEETEDSVLETILEEAEDKTNEETAEEIDEDEYEDYVPDDDEVDLNEEELEKKVGPNTIEFISGKVLEKKPEKVKDVKETKELDVPSFFTDYEFPNELKEQIIAYACNDATSRFPFKKLEELTLYFPLEYSLFHVKTGTRLVIDVDYTKIPELTEYITHDTTSISVEVLFNEQTKTIHSYMFRRIRKNRFMKKLIDFKLSKKSEKDLEKCVNECMDEYYILEEIDSKKEW